MSNLKVGKQVAVHVGHIVQRVLGQVVLGVPGMGGKDTTSALARTHTYTADQRTFRICTEGRKRGGQQAASFTQQARPALTG